MQEKHVPRQSAKLVERALGALLQAADLGDARARHAAAVLQGHRRRPGGRPPVDDAAAVAEVERLTASGRGRGRGREAIGAVAAALAATPDECAAIARRLRRKVKLNGHKEVLSAKSWRSSEG